MSDSPQGILMGAVMVLVPMILSLSVHEWAHAWSAMRLGDNTAEGQGRLTLNPLSHIDPIGTLVLPLMLLVSGAGVFFGWAKPVPFDPTRFRRDVSMRTGTTVVAAAGPISNFLLAIVCQGVLVILAKAGVHEPFAYDFLNMMILMNVGLCVFNLIPIYPLDGQKVLSGLLPYDKAIPFERFTQRYGMIILIVIIVFGNRIGLLSTPIRLLLYGIQSMFGLT